MLKRTILDPILETEMRILPQDQDRSKKIHSTISPDLRVFSFENDFNIMAGDFRVGAYGEIISATLKSNGQSVVLKKFKNYSKGRSELPEDIIKEISFLQLLNIVSLVLLSKKLKPRL